MLKLKKCLWLQPRDNYLGHVVKPGKLAIAADGTKSIAVAEFPRYTTQLNSFLGACKVYQKFVSEFSRLARPLNSMLKKDTGPDWYNPTEEQLEAFRALKQALVTPPVLALPKKDHTYMVDTDSSKYSIEAVPLH